MDMVTQVEIQDETICISNSINTFGKGLNQTVLLPTMGK